MLRNKMINGILFVAVILLTSAAAHAQTRLLRYPSYSNGKVAFSYLGDIWVVNENGSGVQRITDNKAREINPRFSPDGKWIAFSSNRAGNYDVYVVSANGGKPRQLTFHSADDNVIGWTPDGRNILFTSSRGLGVFPGVATLFQISVEGGMEQPLPSDWGSWASYSPDGSKLAFSRHPGVWSRQHYRGSYAVDLWIEDLAPNAAKKYTQISDPEYKGNMFWPMYGHNGEIYFVADRLPSEKNIKFGGPEVMKSVNNIWKISERGGTPVQVTHHTSGKLYFPSISADGKTIVYEEDFGLWKLDVASGKSAEIRVDIKSDTKENDLELRTIQNEAEGFSLSPTGRRAAIATHGEIFTVATDRGEAQRVTETPWREQDPRWSPDGKWIAFVSDRTGRQEIFVADEMGANLKKLSDADGDKSNIVWAPDSKSFLWAGSDHTLRRVEVDSGKTETLATSNTANIGAPQFSPDGKFVSYSKDDSLLRAHVYIKPLDGGAEHMIGSEDFLVANGARWTPDGRKLLLLGGFGAPSMSSLNRTTLQLFSVSLTRAEKNPDDRDIDTEAQAQAALDAGRGGRGAGGAAAPVVVKIEWDGLDRRIRQLTNMPGSVGNIAPSPDSRTIAFVAQGGADTNAAGAGGGPTLYTVGDDGTRLTVIAQGGGGAGGGGGRGAGGGGGFGDLQWTRDSRNIYYLQGGGVYSVGIAPPPANDNAPAAAATGGGGRGGRGGGNAGAAPTAAATAGAPATPRRVMFTVRMEIDTIAERKQVFEEAWRTMKNRFFDPKMHGVDWAAAKVTYEAMLPDIADSEELHNVIMEMIGEISASHTGISGGGAVTDPNERIQTYYPGFDLVSDPAGFYKVAWIYKKGPADHDYVKLSQGDFVLAINGKSLKAGDNYWKHFNLLTGRKFEFTVNSKPQMDGAWTISVEPVTGAAQTNLEYARWVDDRKAMVDKLSNGEIGYLHIRAMDAPSLAKFERDLLDNLDKKALIIDERFNGGGGIDQELLEILNQRKMYESYVGRDSVRIPRPVQAFFGPMVVLQNERSASNAEMFPEGFRTLGLGKVVGVTTYGAVIGTGAFTLLDGSSLRTPGIGVYTASGENFENYGVPPDVYVDNFPPDFLTHHDRQIEKAIEVLRSQMK